ncbi:MAG: hypothetical protein HOJ57_29465 [Lentisphaerae bacterium]|nr:hypothetical protein [Lentisphaerota bacterium]MBT5610106.1 hypothetical protein [Lentisphaerota bacterium]MBT7054194.1 hypothetical protein [Lentisphaerota bacterium]
MQEGDGWQAEVTEGQTIHLFEVPDPGVEECMLIYRAELKTEDFQPTPLTKQLWWLLVPTFIILCAGSSFFTAIVKGGWVHWLWGIVALICAAAFSSLPAFRRKGGAYLEMWCRFSHTQFFSKGFPHALTGTNDWASCETPFYLKRGQRPTLVKLDLALQGSGKVWIRNIQLLKSPLP